MEKGRFKSQVALFEYVWEHSNKKSCISGKDLNRYNGTSWFMSCFSHVLPKSRYTFFKYNPDNVLLITPTEHFLLDQGTEAQRHEYEKEHACSFTPFFKRREELLSIYPKK